VRVRVKIEVRVKKKKRWGRTKNSISGYDCKLGAAY